METKFRSWPPLSDATGKKLQTGRRERTRAAGHAGLYEYDRGFLRREINPTFYII